MRAARAWQFPGAPAADVGGVVGWGVEMYVLAVYLSVCLVLLDLLGARKANKGKGRWKMGDG